MPRWRVGFAGLDDPGVWAAAKQWASCPGVVLAAAADSNPLLLARSRDELGLPRLYRTWTDMLAGEDLHYLHLALPRGERAAVVEEACSRGIHCLVDGPMSSTLDQAERMITAVRRHGTRLLVNWPAAYNSAVIEAFRRVSGEQIGGLMEVSHCRVADADSAPLSALTGDVVSPLDHVEERRAVQRAVGFCAHGAHLCRSFIGLPDGCTGIASRLNPERRQLPSHSVAVLEYRATVALIQGAMRPLNLGPAPDLVLIGSAGAITVSGAVLSMQREGEAFPTEMVVPAELKYGSGPEQLVASVNRDIEIEGLANAQVGRDTQEILEAIEHSVQERRTISLPLR